MALTSWVLGLMLIGGQAAGASASWVTVSDTTGIDRLSFAVQTDPFKPGTLPRGGEVTTLRDAQGRTITGLSYYAWQANTGVHVLVLASVPSKEARAESFPSREAGTRYEQIASFVLKPGESRQVREMRDYGGAPVIVRIVMKP